MFESKYKTLTIIIGAERSGKTFFASKMAKAFNVQGRRAIIYNQGKEEDYPGQECSVLDFEQTERLIFERQGAKAAKAYRRFREIKYMQSPKGIFPIEYMNKALPLMPSVNRILDRKAEERFFQALYDYEAGNLLILEDCKFIVRHGVGARLGNLLYRKNHTGKKAGLREKGMDIVLMFHGIDSVNIDLWDWVTNVVLYPTVNPPTFKNLDNPTLKKIMEKTWAQLDREKAKKGYCYDAYDIKCRGGYRAVKIHGKKIKNF